MSKDTILRLVTTPVDAQHRCGAALADVFKALKAISFYPEGHPLRGENLDIAHRSIVAIIKEKELSLAVNRAGFSLVDGGTPVDNPMATALARELFIRRVQRLTILDDVSPHDLAAFLFLLTTDPQKIVSADGFELMMARTAIRTIWVNEIDLAVIWEKRQAMETREDDQALLEEALARPDVPPEQEETDRSLDEILDLMDRERDDNRYLLLARNLAESAENLKATGNFLPLLAVLDRLLTQNADSGKSAVQREYGVFTFEQIAGGKMAEFLLDLLEDPDYKAKDPVYRIFQQLGEKVAYIIIHRLCIANGLLARKSLATALVRIGPPAVPALLAMLRDERWYVVRNMVAILGEMKIRDCVVELRAPAHHEDQRVRKEAIRALMNLGGKGAESLLGELLDDKDDSIVRQTILSLGIMKSHQAVQRLLEIVEEPDLLLKSLALKIEALQAIGRIGDRRAAPHLASLLESSFWFAWKKGESLRIAAAAALGQIGDESVLPLLKAKAARRGKLGAACGEAVDNIERLAGA